MRYGGIVVAMCKHGCQRPAFGKFDTCCTRCRGPDGPHHEDCEKKGLCGEGCGRRAFVDPISMKMFKTCCKTCSYLHKDKGFCGHDLDCDVRHNSGMCPPWYWKSTKLWPDEFQEEIGGEYVRKMAEKLLHLTMPEMEVATCARVENSVLWKAYTGKRREIRERLLASDIGDWQKFDGYISQGDDMLQEVMTIEEAQVRAAELKGCQGFYFKGAECSTPVQITFKSKWDITKGVQTYTSYRRKDEIKPITSEHIDFSANTTLDHFVNEVWVFHGTSEAAAKGIAQSNFRLPDSPGCFGKGAYFAEAAIKSNQYAKTVDEGDRVGSRVMLLCRVTLGNVYHIEHGSNREAERLVDDPDFDSVVGIAHKYREFLVYDVTQIYPEYVFYFKSRSVDREE